MASLSSSFSIDCIKGSASARLLTKNRLPLGYLNFTDYKNGYMKSAADNLGKCLMGRNHGCCCWKILCLRSSRSGFAENGYGRSSEEDALQKTIEKSNKVLALQKEILVKISERKKLLHSIKNSITNLENGGISFPDRENSHSDSDDISESQDTFEESEAESSVASFPSASSGQDLGPKRVLTENDNSPTKASNLQYEGIVESALKKVTNTLNNSIPLAGDNVMNILFVAAECAPWSKTGGLGDVAAALPKALAQRGHRVMVVVPRYENYVEAQNTGIIRRYMVAGQDIEVSYYHTYVDGADFVFIDCALFHGIESEIYGGKREDVLKRMVLFCKAAIEVPWHVPCGESCYGDGNLVFIANDWHTALLPVYLKAYYQDNGLMRYARSVLVIHNIAHQGRGPVNEFSYVDLPEHYLDSFRLYDPLGGEHLNIFAAGLKAAHRIVTVSHGYAWELKTQEGGWGLHNIINENDWKLRGIVNGIDPSEWNPESDVYLKSDGFLNYSVDTLKVGKAKCKEALQRELNLPVLKDIPLVGFIGRLDDQKGVDIIGKSITWMMEQNVQLVMLGMGRPDLEQMLRDSESENHDRIRGLVGFSVKTAHRITAGVDILLMPSRFEPCGLNQLYAMRYGTVPVVHAVGGLKDTVLPYDPFNESGYGWTFDRAESDKLKEALWNCLLTFRQYRESWEGLQRRGMMQNLSWDHAAEMYEQVIVAAKYQW